jgi:hypothetical protein
MEVCEIYRKNSGRSMNSPYTNGEVAGIYRNFFELLPCRCANEKKICRASAEYAGANCDFPNENVIVID